MARNCTVAHGQRKVKADGRRSSEAAHKLMLMTEAALKHLDLEVELRDAFLKARNLPTPGARRREERRLAGVLRLGDLGEIEQRLANQEEGGRADGRLFKMVEAWRTRLIAGDTAALEAFHQEHPGQERRVLDKMIHEAVREDARGKPKGAKKALFRYIATTLKASS